MAYNNRFYMPSRNDSKIGHNMWFSFENGPVTFVSVDTETNFPNSFFPQYNFNGEQLVWLDQTLKNINRKKTPWVIVVGHRPIYSSQNVFSNATGEIIGESKILQDAFEDILYNNNVDIMMVGHVHSYERTHPVYKTKVEKTNGKMHNLRYPIHIVNGAGGNIEGLTATTDFYFNQEWKASILNKDEGYGILRTTFDRLTKVHSLKFNYHYAKTNEVVDSFTITKDSY